MQYSTEIIPVCDPCKNSEQKQCSKCGIAYCEHYSSDIDIRFCGNCMVAVTLITETETRITDHKNASGVITYSKRDVCKRLRLTGSDYFFAAYKISELNDADLETTIEYHRAIMSAMVMEREDRKTERMHKLAHMPFKLGPRRETDQDGAIKGSLRTDKQKADRKITRTPKAKGADALAEALKILMGAGLTAEQISKLSGGK